MMKRALAFLTALVAGVALAGSGTTFAAPQTWTGFVSDSQCGADHGGEVEPRECTQKCIKAGDKYVLAIELGTKVLPIANQDFPALAEFAGENAKVTGELSGGAIVVSKIEKP